MGVCVCVCVLAPTQNSPIDDNSLLSSGEETPLLVRSGERKRRERSRGLERSEETPEEERLNRNSGCLKSVKRNVVQGIYILEFDILEYF